jgi:hypothetical protein
MEPSPTSAIDRLVFVYDADGSVVGEIRYWVGTLFGAEHCSLCDLTHTRWGRRAEFRSCASRLGVPIVTHHRDDAPPEVLAVATPPAVVGITVDGPVVVLDRAALAGLGGDLVAFERALRTALERPVGSD